MSASTHNSQQSASAASAQQIEANRRNAQLSTGPRTADGKAASSTNASKSGLFAAHLNVRQNEATEYEAMRDDFLNNFRPMGAFEESLALQIINANWRLRRCASAELAIPVLTFTGPGWALSAHERSAVDNAGRQNEANPDGIHDFDNPAQKAIDRARASAENTIRRVSKDLKELQAERWRRATLKLTGPIEPEELGLAPIKEAMSAIPTDSERNYLMVRAGMLKRSGLFPTQTPVATGDSGRLQNEPNPGPGRLAAG